MTKHTEYQVWVFNDVIDPCKRCWTMQGFYPTKADAATDVEEHKERVWKGYRRLCLYKVVAVRVLER